MIKNRLHQAFTLIELLIVVAVLGIIVGIAIPALRTAKDDATNRSADGNAKTLNDGRARAVLDGKTDPTLTGSNELALASYLLEQGYIDKR